MHWSRAGQGQWPPGQSFGQLQKANDPGGAEMLLAMPMWGPRHLWLLLSCNSACPGNPELYSIYKHTWSGLGNLGSLALLLIEFWGSVHFPNSPSHQSHRFYFRSLLIIFHFLFPAEGLPGFVCSLSVCSKGFQSHVRQALEQLLMHFLPPLYPWTEFPRLKSWKIHPGNLA